MSVIEQLIAFLMGGGIQPTDMPRPQVLSIIESTAERIRLGDFKGAVSFFRTNRHKLSHEERHIAIEAFNSHYLFAREREWTKHGIHRSFRFWTQETKVECLTVSQSIVEKLQAEYGGAACFGYGAVLGGVRERDLIPHDDDVDVIVALPKHEFRSFQEGTELVSRFLAKEGYRIGRHLCSHRHVRAGEFSIDVFVGYEMQGTVSWLPGPCEFIRKDEVFPAKPISLLGVECSLPAQPEAYLEKVYGESWRTPIKRWNHAWKQHAAAFGLPSPQPK